MPRSSSASPTNAMHEPEAGTALLLALLVTTLLSGLALALATVAAFEHVAADDDRQAQVVAYAADAALESAMQELGAVTNWDAVLRGGVVSARHVPSSRPSTAWGDILDLVVTTTDLQAQTTSSVDLGANTPQWRLFLSTALSGLMSTGGGEPWPHVLVWVADDRSETDDDPAIDGNDTIWLHARAIGPRGMRRDVEAVVSRLSSANGVQLVTWRALR